VIYHFIHQIAHGKSRRLSGVVVVIIFVVIIIIKVVFTSVGGSVAVGNCVVFIRHFVFSGNDF